MARGNSADDGRLEAVVRGVQGSKRYQYVSGDTVRRLATSALEIERGHTANAVKRTKRGLHEIFGAFLPTPPKYANLLSRLRAAVQAAPDDPLADPGAREVVTAALSGHASTRERLPILSDFYGAIFERIGDVGVVRDVACGLNPLAVPWMPLPVGVRYLASDIDSRMVEFLDAALEVLGVEHRTEVRDLVNDPDPAAADVTFLLKTVPCLETQVAEHGWGLIDRINSPTVVVSFPTRSLGKRSKGMYNTYSAAFRSRAEQRTWSVEEIEFVNELVYVVRKDGS